LVIENSSLIIHPINQVSTISKVRRDHLKGFVFLTREISSFISLGFASSKSRESLLREELPDF